MSARGHRPRSAIAVLRALPRSSGGWKSRAEALGRWTRESSRSAPEHAQRRPPCCGPPACALGRDGNGRTTLSRAACRCVGADGAGGARAAKDHASNVGGGGAQRNPSVPQCTPEYPGAPWSTPEYSSVGWWRYLGPTCPCARARRVARPFRVCAYHAHGVQAAKHDQHATGTIGFADLCEVPSIRQCPEYPEYLRTLSVYPTYAYANA
jgi:hypothetical protein